MRKTLWAQYLRMELVNGVFSETVLLDSAADVRKGLHELVWAYPDAQYHLHLGMYRNNQKQVTVIVEGVPYRGYGTGPDILGDRLTSGTLLEMLELAQVYAKLI